MNRTKPEPLKYFEQELNLNPNRYSKRFDTLLTPYLPIKIVEKVNEIIDQIKSFTKLAVIRRNLQRVCMALFIAIAPEIYSFFPKNIAAVASRWQHCVRFKSQTSHSIDKRVTAQPIGRLNKIIDSSK